MEEKEIHLRDYIQVILKRKYTILLFFIIVFVSVLFSTVTSIPVYTASTRVMIQKTNADALMGNRYYIPYDPEFLETQTQIITSTAVARKVVDLLDLEASYERFFPPDANQPGKFQQLKWAVKDMLYALLKPIQPDTTSFEEQTGEMSSLPDFAKEDPITMADAIAMQIQGGISISPLQNTKIVSISYTSTNPVFSRLVVNAIAVAYKDRLMEMKMENSNQALRWMKLKADEERVKLEASETRLQSYLQSQNILTIENKVAVIPERLKELGIQLTRAEAKRKEVETIYHQIRNTPDEEAESIPVISASKSLQAIRTEILDAEQRIWELSEKYGKKHPEMIRAMRDLEGLNKRKEKEIQGLVTMVRNDYELARSNEENLRKLLKTTKAEAVRLNEKFIQYNILNRDVETNKHVYDALISKMKEQNLTEKTQNVEVAVIEKAMTPTSPSNQRTKRNLLLGLVLGLFGGIGFAFFLEYLDNTIKTAEDAEERIGLPVFGTIPFLRDKNEQIESVTRTSPLSPVSESFKGLRTSVLLSAAGRIPRSLLITSMGPGEGKTTSAANLAVTLAQSGKTILLIDADLRRPRIHDIFSLPNTAGLSTLLTGEGSITELSRSTDVTGLSVLPSGSRPPNPSELLSGEKLTAIVAEAQEHFDMVLVDSAPILSVSDSLILARLLEGTLVVTRSGVTTYEAAQKGVKQFRDIDARIMGIIVNAIDTRKVGGYAYYADSYYYATAE